jgi:hypothetical protein
MKLRHHLLLILVLSIAAQSMAQDSLSSLSSISPKYLESISQKAGKLHDNLDKKSKKALAQFQKQEEKLRRKVSKIDSTKANAIFNGVSDQYKALGDRLQNGILSKPYVASLDTMVTSLKFLQQNPELLAKAKEGKATLEQAIGKVKGLQGNLQKADEIKRFLKERRQYLKDQLGNLGFTKELKRLNKQAYYFSQQINEYKSLLKDHKKAERKAIELLAKTKLFKDFMRKNSQLASLFRLPGNPADPTAQVSLAGLQTRAQINGLLQQRIAAGGANGMAQFRQNINQAQNQLNQQKGKISKLGGGSSDMEMPEGFKPNNQKTKSFLKRLEFGTNIQSLKANGFFPTTSDIGLSIGYKLNDKSVLGIGASYKVGWGKDIRHIRVSHQGAGIRSFIDWKVKGSLWVSGGYEMNYRSEFREVDALKDLNAWQQSGLIGMSKIISMKTKLFKKTRLQLFWDFMSYRQVPHTQPVIFRVGYTF